MIKDRISELEDRSIEFIKSEQQRESKIYTFFIEKKWAECQKLMRHDKRSNNIHIIVVSEGVETKNGTEKLFKDIVTENLPNMVENINIVMFMLTFRKPSKPQAG